MLINHFKQTIFVFPCPACGAKEIAFHNKGLRKTLALDSLQRAQGLEGLCLAPTGDSKKSAPASRRSRV
jgi:hypothetical protein